MMDLFERGNEFLKIINSDKTISECLNKSVSVMSFTLNHHEEDWLEYLTIHFRNQEEKNYFIKNVIDECLESEKDIELITSTVNVDENNSSQIFHLSDESINDFIEKCISFLDEFNYIDPLNQLNHHFGGFPLFR